MDKAITFFMKGHLLYFLKLHVSAVVIRFILFTHVLVVPISIEGFIEMIKKLVKALMTSYGLLSSFDYFSLKQYIVHFSYHFLLLQLFKDLLDLIKV